MENPFSGAGKADIARRLPASVSPDTISDYVEDAWARALGVAPAIADDSFPEDKHASVKAVLRAIILRWHEAQSGAITGRSQQAGPYAQNVQLDQRPKRGYTLMPSEIVDLQRIVRAKGAMFSVDTMPDADHTTPATFVNGPHSHISANPPSGDADVPSILLNGPTSPVSESLGW